MLLYGKPFKIIVLVSLFKYRYNVYQIIKNRVTFRALRIKQEHILYVKKKKHFRYFSGILGYNEKNLNKENNTNEYGKFPMKYELHFGNFVINRENLFF